MPLCHTKCVRPFKYPIPGTFDPATNTHGPPIWATGCRETKCIGATLPPGVIIVDNVGLDARQTRILNRLVARIERDPSNVGATIFMVVDYQEKEKDKTMRPYKDNDHHHKYRDDDDDYGHRLRRKCYRDTYRTVDALLRKYLHSRGADAPNKASCRPNCNDLLLSPETLCTLTGGNRSVWFPLTLGAALPPGESLILGAPVGPLGVSATYCLSDFLVSPDTVLPDAFLIEVLVNGQVRKDFAGGLVRSASNCNTLCGWCVCVGALETISFRITNISAAAIPTGTVVRMQTQRWFPGEDGYVCPSCSCVVTKGSCGCGKKKKRPPLSHHPRPAEYDFEVADSTSVDVDVNVDVDVDAEDDD